MSKSRLKAFFQITAIALGSAETIAARHSIRPDSRSYLEIARAYLRHDWAMAVNAYWSPLYSWLAAIVLGVTRPSWRWEYPTIHAMNFMIYLVTITAFEFFWSGIQRSESGVPRPILWALGYSLFIWLGVALAFGYFAKAVLFPMAFVFLLSLLLARVPLKKIAWSAAIFLAISAP